MLSGVLQGLLKMPNVEEEYGGSGGNGLCYLDTDSAEKGDINELSQCYSTKAVELYTTKNSLNSMLVSKKESMLRA